MSDAVSDRDRIELPAVGLVECASYGSLRTTPVGLGGRYLKAVALLGANRNPCWAAGRQHLTESRLYR